MPKTLRVFFWVSFCLTLLSFLRVGYQWTHGNAAALQHLYMADAGFDYDDYAARFRHLHSARFFSFPGYEWVYPASAVFVLWPFYQLPLTPWAGFVPYVIASLTLASIAAVFFGRALIKAGLQPRYAVALLGGCALTSWPVYFAIQRGNIESLIWPFIALAVALWWWERPYAAAVVLGVFGSIKLYPAVFLGLLFLKRKQWGALSLLSVAFAATMIAGLWVIDPNVHESLTAMQKGIHDWTVFTSESMTPLEFDHSFFGLLKQTALPHHTLHRGLLRYQAVAAVGGLGLIWYVLQRASDAVAVVLLTLACITLPPTSFDYTLGLLYIPFGLLALQVVTTQRQSLDLAALYALCLSPLAFISFHNAGLGGAARSVALLVLGVWTALRYNQQAGTA